MKPSSPDPKSSASFENFIDPQYIKEENRKLEFKSLKYNYNKMHENTNTEPENNEVPSKK